MAHPRWYSMGPCLVADGKPCLQQPHSVSFGVFSVCLYAPPPLGPAELYLPELRSCFRVILYETSSIAIVSFIACTVVMYAAAELVPWLTVLDPACRWSVCTIAGERWSRWFVVVPCPPLEPCVAAGTMCCCPHALAKHRGTHVLCKDPRVCESQQTGLPLRVYTRVTSPPPPLFAPRHFPAP